MTDADRKELMDLIAEYRAAVIVEGGVGRIRQLKRIVKHVEAVEAAAIERCAKICESTYAKDAFHFELGTACANAIRALLPKEE